MTAAADQRARLSNQNLARRIASVQRGTLCAQLSLHAIRNGEGGGELLEEARANLADDPDALVAFGKALARGREVRG